GEIEAALRKHSQAAELLPASAAPHYHLACLEMDRGNLVEARRRYSEALRLDPSYGKVRVGVGLQQYLSGEYRAAEESFEATLRLDPENAEAHYGLGLLAKRRRDGNRAATLLATAVRHDNRLMDGHRALADVLAEQGRISEAIESYQSALRLALEG